MKVSEFRVCSFLFLQRGIQFNMNDIFAMLRHKLSFDNKPDEPTEGVNTERQRSSSIQVCGEIWRWF